MTSGWRPSPPSKRTGKQRLPRWLRRLQVLSLVAVSLSWLWFLRLRLQGTAPVEYIALPGIFTEVVIAVIFLLRLRYRGPSEAA